MKQRIEQFERKDAQRVNDMTEMFETQARFSDRLMKLENSKRDQEPSQRSGRSEQKENYGTLQAYRPKSPPSNRNKAGMSRSESVESDLDEEFENFMQKIQANPDLMQRFMQMLNPSSSLNQGIPVFKDRANSKMNEPT